MFTLASSCSTTSNLPWFMDLTFQVPMQYCSYSIRLYFHHQSHPQLGVFSLWLRLFILSGVISPIFSSSILGTYWPGELIFQCRIFLPFHSVHWNSQGKNAEVVCLSFSSGPCFVRTLHLTHLSWVVLHSMAHRSIELDKAVIHVINLVSFLWLWFSLCLMAGDKRLVEASWLEGLAPISGETGSCSGGQSHAQ